MENKAGKRSKILIVDDDQEIWEVYQAVLSSRRDQSEAGQKLGKILKRGEPAPEEEALGFDLAFAAQGEDGLHLVRESLDQERPFALACIDMRMPPGWNGMKTATEIRNIDPDIEIVIITAFSDRRREEIVRAVGSPDKLLILRKPFDPDEVAQLAVALTTKWNMAKQQQVQQRLLEASEKRYRTVFEASVDGFSIYRTDAKGQPRLIDCNDSFSRLAGRSKEELLACPDMKRLQHTTEDSPHGCCFGRPGEGQRCHAVFSWARPDGVENYIECRGIPVTIDGKSAVLTVHRDITESKKAEEKISHLSRRLIHVVEEERKKIALDLHDEFGQILPPLQFAMKAVQDKLPDEFLHGDAQFERLGRLADRLGFTCRNILAKLRPDMLDRMGLLATIKWGVNEFAVQHKDVQVDFSVVGVDEKKLNPDIEIVLYRIFQEGMNNIVKHAQARHLEVMLAFSHPHIILTMIDDGVGFDLKQAQGATDLAAGGLGLSGMRERAASVGGELILRSQKGKGTMLRVKLPIK